MTPQNQTIRCTSCGQPFAAQIRTVVDAQNDPQGKNLLMAGRLNTFPCPHCGHTNQVLTPLLYHDAEKSLLIAMIPMEVSLKSGQPDEKIVGDLLNELTRSIPKEQFRSYMFSPKRALTMQGLLEQVMEADGITPDMLNAQKARVELIQKLLSAKDEAELVQLVQANDARIDLSFFQTLSLMAQRVLEDGRQDVAAGLMSLQQALLMVSSYGKQLAEERKAQEQVVEEVARDIQALSQQATRADVIDLAFRYANDEARLQALVGLVRGAFDEQLFLEMTQRISQAPAQERDSLQKVMDTLKAGAAAIDQQQRARLQQAVQFLQALVNSPDPTALLQENLDLVDNNFMQILNANLQEAQKRGDQNLLMALSRVNQLVMQMLQSQMSDELLFINALLGTDSEAQMQAMLAQEANKFDKNTLIGTCVSVIEAIDPSQIAIHSRLQTILDALEAL
jgi:predicted RNA-binding Zn-ribbon protein involved in translation (DUF1610 family)